MDGAVLEEVVQREGPHWQEPFQGFSGRAGGEVGGTGEWDCGMTPVREKFLYCSYFFLPEGAHTRRKWMMS